MRPFIIRRLRPVIAVALAVTLIASLASRAVADGVQDGQWSGSWGYIPWGNSCASQGFDVSHHELTAWVNGFGGGGVTWVEYLVIENKSRHNLTFPGGILVRGGVDDTGWIPFPDLDVSQSYRIDLRRSFGSSKLTIQFTPALKWGYPHSSCGPTSLQADSTGQTPIGQRYDVMGGRYAAELGGPTAPEMNTRGAGGRWQNFQNGMIIWHPSVYFARAVYGNILNKYRELGSETGPLGYPTTNETSTSPAGGRWQGFQGGMILWKYGPGAHWLHGAILDRFRASGSERYLGYPTSDEYPWGVNGRRQTFERAFINWTPAQGAWVEWR